jgi:hypothetical protein
MPLVRASLPRKFGDFEARAWSLYERLDLEQMGLGLKGQSLPICLKSTTPDRISP